MKKRNPKFKIGDLVSVANPVSISTAIFFLAIIKDYYRIHPGYWAYDLTVIKSPETSKNIAADYYGVDETKLRKESWKDYCMLSNITEVINKPDESKLYQVGDKVKINLPLVEKIFKECGWENLWETCVNKCNVGTLCNRTPNEPQKYGTWWHVGELTVDVPESCFSGKVETSKETKHMGYKIVVTKYPNKDVEIDYEYLEKNNACQDAKIDFVKQYGASKVKVSEIIKDIYNKFAKLSLTSQYQSVDSAVENFKRSQLDYIPEPHKSWIMWLDKKTGFSTFYHKDTEDCTLTKDCTTASNIYILESKTSGELYKLQITYNGYLFLTLSCSVGRWNDQLITSDLESFLDYILSHHQVIIYEFTSAKDFAEWYCDKVKGVV